MNTFWREFAASWSGGLEYLGAFLGYACLSLVVVVPIAALTLIIVKIARKIERDMEEDGQ